MNPIVSKIRKYGGSHYLLIPPEIVEQYGLKESDLVAYELQSLKTEPLKPVDDGE